MKPRGVPEWRLFHEELPENLPVEYINPRAAFLYNGLWRGAVNDHYAKTALLIYLQQHYAGSCGDIVGGIYPQGGSSYGIYVARLKGVDLSQVFQYRAHLRRLQGTWAELFAEFPRYYAE